MPNSRSAPYVAFGLFAAASGLLFGACSGFLVTPGAGTGGTGGKAGTGATGVAGTTGSAGITGSAGTGAGGVGIAGAAGSAGTGAAGTGVAGSGGTTGVGNTAGTGTGAAGTTGGTGGGGGAGTNGTAGTGGSGGTAGSAALRGPLPAANGVNFPFPQNRALSGCVYPAAYSNADVKAAFEQWKQETVVSDGAGNLRVQRLASDPQSALTPLNSTVSEGIAYGMIIAVYMGDKGLFDGLWKYEQQHRAASGLMNWSIRADGSVAGMGAATDADEDMAFALVMADRQWGGYANDAQYQIKAVWNFEIWESKLPRNGDGWGDWNNLNISYFAPAYYRIFKQVDTDTSHKWDDVINTSYDTITSSLKAANGNMTNGLVPAWCTSTGNAVAPAPGSSQPFHYQYDSCRTPFRIGLDWCWFGETRARDYVAKTSTFFAGIGAANIVDGYNLDGTKRVQFSPANATPTIEQQSASFLGPAGVGAMSSTSYQTFLNDTYARLATRKMLVGGSYYDQSWGVMSLLMMTGNYLNYRAITPYTGP